MGWLSEGRLLALFCAATLLLFSDRGVISCNSVNGTRRTSAEKPGYGIQGYFDLSLVEDGLLAAALVIGLMFSAPTFAQLSRRFPALRLIGAGLSLWVLGTAGCSLAPNFPVMLFCRLLVGTACGPFIALAAPTIDDISPPRQKSLWLAALFLCMPTGFALGYIMGGVVGTSLGWRAAFAVEAAAMLPLAVITLMAPPLKLRGSKAAAGAEGAAPVPPAEGAGDSGGGAVSKALAVLAADCRQLAASRVALITILALSLYNGALGCYSFYGPKAARDIFELHPETADLLFGAITVLTGVLGTLCGGLALDAMGPSVRNALILCTGGVGTGCVLVMAGFAAAKTMAWFGPAFAAGEFGMFLMAAPVNAVLMWSVPPNLRPFSLAAAEFMQHLVGDIPSPPALGWLQGKLENWRLSMCAATALLALSFVLFCLALSQSRGAVSYREVLQVEGGQLLEGEEDAGAAAGAGDAVATGASAAGRHGGGSGEAADLEQPLLPSSP